MANLKYYDPGTAAWETLVIGKQGPSGPAGPTGPTGPGGTAAIASATAPVDTTAIWYNTENGNSYIYYDGFWTSISGLPSIPTGGTTGQVLAKTSSTDYATEWVAPSGLVHIATQTVSGVSSISFNNCFSSTYRNYKIVGSGSYATRGNLYSRLRVGGVDASSSNYSETIQYRDTATFATGYTASATNSTIAYLETDSNIFSADIASPFLATKTVFNSNNTGTGGAGTSTWVWGGIHNLATSYDGITLYGSAFTGSISIYGYRI